MVGSSCALYINYLVYSSEQLCDEGVITASQVQRLSLRSCYLGFINGTVKIQTQACPSQFHMLSVSTFMVAEQFVSIPNFIFPVELSTLGRFTQQHVVLHLPIPFHCTSYLLSTLCRKGVCIPTECWDSGSECCKACWT